jgi:type II secretory pathway pseudopilin PulG
MVQWQPVLSHPLFSLPRQRSAGFYMVELMLSLTLSSIIIVILLSLTFAGWQTYLTSMNYANTNDSSRAAFIFLDRQFSAAGYRAFMWETPEAVYPSIAATANYPAFAAGQVIIATPSVTTGSANNSNVILYIRKQGGFQDDYDASGTLQDPLPWASSLTTDVIVTDCLGERIPSKVVIIERYRIDSARRLVCSRVFVDSSSPAYYVADPTQDVLILNYAYAMRAAFGTYTAGDPKGQIQNYNNLQTMRTGSTAIRTERWKNVVNIRLDILIARGDDRNIDNSIGRAPIRLIDTSHAVVSVPAKHFATVESRVINLKSKAY